MRALKVLVIVMGILLVVGTIGLVLAVMNRANHPIAATTAPAAATPPADGSSTIDLPAGAKVIATEFSGDRVLIRVGLVDGAEQLILVNAVTGLRLGLVTLRPGKP
jgi:hypothetical protein